MRGLTALLAYHFRDADGVFDRQRLRRASIPAPHLLRIRPLHPHYNPQPPLRQPRPPLPRPPPPLQTLPTIAKISQLLKKKPLLLDLRDVSFHLKAGIPMNFAGCTWLTPAVT
eukprot:UN25114